MGKKKSGAGKRTSSGVKPIQSTKKSLLRYLLPALALVAVVVIVVMLVSPGGLPEPSDEKKAEIKEAWLTRNKWHWYDEGSASGCRYYGEFQGYHVVMYVKPTMIPKELEIADAVFTFGRDFELFASNGTELRELRSVYDDGLISGEDIAAIAKLHDGLAKDLPALSAEEKKKIESLWVEENAGLNWDSGAKKKHSARYYGVYSGFDVFLHVEAVPPESLSYYSFRIGETIFELDCSANFYGYKDGSVYRLRDLYNAEEIGEKDLAAIAAEHARNG